MVYPDLDLVHACVQEQTPCSATAYSRLAMGSHPRDTPSTTGMPKASTLASLTIRCTLDLSTASCCFMHSKMPAWGALMKSPGYCYYCDIHTICIWMYVCTHVMYACKFLHNPNPTYIRIYNWMYMHTYIHIYAQTLDPLWSCRSW